MLEQIASNPEHTVIRGDWASYHCDSTSTCHWFDEISKGGVIIDGEKKKWSEKLWDLLRKTAKLNQQIKKTEREKTNKNKSESSTMG